MRDGVAYLQDTTSSVYAIDLAHGPQAVGAAQAGAERRPQRPRARRRHGSTAPATRRCSRSTPPTAASSGARSLVSRTEQFVNIAPVVDRGRVYVSTVGFPPGGRGRDLRARRGDGKAALAVRHDQGAVAEPRGRRRRCLGAAERRSGRSCLRGHREPGALGRVAAVPERRLVPRADALHRLARRPGRRHAGSSSGTTRCSRTTSGTTTSSSRPILATVGGTRPRDRRGQGRAHLRLGPGHPRADLDAGRGHAPQRRRPAAREAGRGVPRPLRRRPHSDGLRGGPGVRPGRRAVHAGERGEDRLGAAAAAGGGHRRRSPPSTPPPGEPLWTRTPSVRAVRVRHGGVRRGLRTDLRRVDLRALGHGRGRSSGATARRPGSTAVPRSPETRCSCPQAHRIATSQSRCRS